MKVNISDLSILIADDSATQRLYAKELCKDLGVAQIYEAASGVDALLVLQNYAVDVVLVDLEMPVMDGIELIRAIAANKFASNIIILSAKAPILITGVGTMAEASGLHVLGTFQKPLLPDVLECSLLRFIYDKKSNNQEIPLAREMGVSAFELSQALINGEITLAFQPKLSVQGLLLKGAEALARWEHPQKGMISPSVFIPIAERHGMIDSLTRHLLHQAFQYKKIWQQYGLCFNLAFNISPLSLADVDIVEWVTEIALHYSISPSDITLETTENAFFGELASAVRTLACLRLKGFHIAIDDDGTGYANAQQLSCVPATELKIDRSLVHQVAAFPQQRTILAKTVDLGKNLNLKTVAKGVETEEDFSIVEALGIDLVQGFYFSEPLFSEDFLQWIRTDLTQLRCGHEL